MAQKSQRSKTSGLLPDLPLMRYLILTEFEPGEVVYGDALAERVERSLGHSKRLSPGTIYQVLERLADDLLIERVEGYVDDTRNKRRVYYRLSHLAEPKIVKEIEAYESLARRGRRFRERLNGS
ncbi:hypothetical protein HGA91_02680 [candidate division WWE3 bacterium]|nr:hypothetical protein [candidate division WWE3 bacterium]